MNTPDNNPYPDSSPSPAKSADGDKGTVLAGFFIGWGLVIGSSMLGGFLVSILAGFSNLIGGYNSLLFQGVSGVSFTLPLVTVIVAMVWLGNKGKSKIVKGIAAAIASMIALVLLLVAACFGIFAMSGSGFH